MTVMRLEIVTSHVGERIERIDQLLRAHAARRLHFDLHFLGSEIVHRLDLDLPFVRRVFDGGDE